MMAETIYPKEAIDWLASLGFEYSKHPALGNLLIANKESTAIIARAAQKDCNNLFRYALPAFELRIRTAADLVAFAEIARVAGGATNQVFTSLIHLIRFLNPDTIENLAVLARDAGSNNIVYIFCYGLPDIYGVLNAENILQAGELFLQLARTAGKNAGNVFVLFLPYAKHLIVSINDILPVGYALIEAWENSVRGKNLEVFVRGFLAAKRASSSDALRKAA